MRRPFGALAAVLFASATASAGDATKSLAVFGIAGQGFHLEGQGFSEFGAVGIAASRRIGSRFEAEIELQPVFLIRQPRRSPRGPRETVAAAACDVGLRVYAGPPSWRVRPYFELLDGPFYGARRIPEGGTKFNFLTQAGIGAVLPAGERFHPTLALRWVHVSNAGIGRRNPDWDHWAVLFGARRSW